MRLAGSLRCARSSAVAVRLIALLAGRGALGQPAGGQPLSVEPPPSPPQDASEEDAHVDRVVLMPTATTHPAGTTTLSDYDVAILQVGYAITDRAQISLTAIPPLGGDRLLPLDLTLKATLLHRGLVRAAAFGSVSGVITSDGTVLFVGRGGGVVQLCFVERCDSSVTLGTSLVPAGAVLLASGVGAIWRLARRVALLAEADTLVPFSPEAAQANGASVEVGVRFLHARFSIDLAALHVLGSTRAPPVVPVIAATSRWGGAP